ncbi:hypothetical protein ACFX19_041109 [Malus domestica]
MEPKEAVCSIGAEVECQDITSDPRTVLTTSSGEGTSAGAVRNDQAELPDQTDAPLRSNLNPFAEEWHPILNMAPEEDRCCFFTFSNGYPLTERQIINFFTEQYGGWCVERVYIHRPETREEKPPLFGRIVFRSVLMTEIVLGGEEEVKFRIDRRPLWCKRFDKERVRRPIYN